MMTATSGRRLSPVLVVAALLVGACGGGDDEVATDPAPSTTSTSAATTGSLVASTTSTNSTSTAETSTADDPATTDPTTTGPTTDPSTTTTVELLVIDGASGYEFTSPSGNIACTMSDAVASCWIGEKAWTIDQPSGPECEVSDWGNAVDLTAEGPSFPCYTDMAWNPAATALPYWHAVELGPFRCDSAPSGVTCTNAGGNGFTVARAAVQLF